MLGTYKGTYKYNKHLNVEYVNTGIEFTILITYFDGMHFKGSITDDLESGGTRGEGNIDGTIKNDRIEFVKQMPIMTLGLHDGMRIELPKKHNPIYYSGIYNDKTFEGAWKIKSGIIFNKYMFAIRIGTKGTWKMTKE